MNEREQKQAAQEFAEKWAGHGYEKGETQAFWLSLLRDVLGVDKPEEHVKFEVPVTIETVAPGKAKKSTKFIDLLLPETRVMVEQKGSHKDLRENIKQSDGVTLTPYQQAKRYAASLRYSQMPRWVVTCNFAEFIIYDMDNPQGEPVSFLLKDLPKHYGELSFMVKFRDERLIRELELSVKAGEIVGKIYDALLKEYHDPTNEQTLQSLNKLCVRLVFCLYADASGLFGRRKMFHELIKSFGLENIRIELITLFSALSTPADKRDPYMNKKIAAFPYVDGGLFEDEYIEIPYFSEEFFNLLLHDASEQFDWSGISPTIFGAVFESTLNPETRRKGGMHYTSIENIHKVIDPLFLDDLKQEFREIKEIKTLKTRMEKLERFQDKLAGLTFFDIFVQKMIQFNFSRKAA